MSDNTEIIQPVLETPVTLETTPVAPVVEEEKSYSYQPTDENGRTLGGRQVIKYRTQDELIQKIQDQNVLLIRKLRSETRKNRLGISDPEEISDTAPRFQEPVDFKPIALTPDQRVKLSRDLLDPEHFDEAANTLFESTLGVRPDVLRQTFTTLQSDNLQFKAKIEADAFVAANADYIKCPENFEAITSWMERYKLAPLRENFQKAYNTLKAADVLVQAGDPVSPALEQTKLVPSTPESMAAPEPPPVAAPVPAPARVPSGLTREQATDSGTPRQVGEEIVYVLTRTDGSKQQFSGSAALKAMPADEYKKRLRDPAFRKLADRLEAEDAQKRAQRGR